ncbi:MAG: ABC transporter permease [Corynebacterium sp.]|nr:ABC transporter permease [Corynebacterium sp.]
MSHTTPAQFKTRPKTSRSFHAVGNRILQALVVLLLTYTLAFFLLAALPSDGVLARYASPELGLSETEIATIRESYGADKPLILQYLSNLGGFLTGDFGYSVQTGTAVSTLITEALPSTLALALIAFLFAIIFAFLTALASSLSPVARSFFMNLPSFFVSLPSFWVGIILIQVVSFQLGWIPIVEASPAQAIILPALTLSVPIAAPLSQVMIRSIAEVQQQPFISVVRAKGASESWIFFKNVLRNAMLPTITMAGILFGELVGGAVVTEAVFGRTGIGKLTVDAVTNRDTPVLLAVVLITATAYVLINLLVDLTYPLIDPRLRTHDSATAHPPVANSLRASAPAASESAAKASTPGNSAPHAPQEEAN